MAWPWNDLESDDSSGESDKFPTRQNLTDIARGLTHAALSVEELQDQQYIRQVDRYFDRNEDGSLSAKLVRIKTGEDSYIQVPLISLVRPEGIGLDELEVDLSIRLTQSDVKQHTHHADESIVTRSSFGCEITRSSRSDDRARRPGDVVDLKLKFRRQDPPEGISRILEQFDNFVSLVRDEEDSQ